MKHRDTEARRLLKKGFEGSRDQGIKKIETQRHGGIEIFEKRVKGKGFE
ncbi:MAG: hypothetical protein N2738_04300 [Thermodesulfovibrionales bacterium]|nr:hypothetical protein [Thermodesulfovibrionales bacterium]